MKNIIFILFMIGVPITTINAQQICKNKKHEIGIDVFPVFGMLDDINVKDYNNFNITYKYYFKKFAFKIRLGGEGSRTPANDDNGLATTRNWNGSGTIYYHKNEYLITNIFQSTIGFQYHLLTLAQTTFFMGLDFRSQIENSTQNSLGENWDSLGTLTHSVNETRHIGTYSSSLIASMGLTYRFKNGFGLTYEATYGYNWNREYHHIIDYDYRINNPSYDVSFSTISNEKILNLKSNLTLSYRF